MRILVYEPVQTGHHLADLSRLLPGLLELPAQIIWATTSQVLESDEYAATIGEPPKKLRIETCCESPPGRGVLAVNWHQFRECRRIAWQFKPDHLYIMMGDGKWQLLEAIEAILPRQWRRHLGR